MDNTSLATYPASIDIDYPDHELNKLTTFFRPFVVIPVAIVLALVSGPTMRLGWENMFFGAGGLLFLPTLLAILFRHKYPHWWFDWNLALTRFSMRVSSYLTLLTDRYPSFEEEQGVHVELKYPEVSNLNPWMPLVKWFLAIPHYICLWALSIAAVVCITIAWFAILFTGKYPRSLFNFVVGVFRWSMRVTAYAFLLTTDEYPPFALS